MTPSSRTFKQADLIRVGVRHLGSPGFGSTINGSGYGNGKENWTKWQLPQEVKK